jgi:cell division transport system permease protein
VVTGVVGAVLAGVGLVVGKLAFIDSLLAGIAQNGVIPPITLVDVVMTSVWLVPIGAAIAGITGYITLRLYVKV